MDMLVDDGFVETLPESQRLAHDVLRNYGFYLSSSVRQRRELLEAAVPEGVPEGRLMMEAGYSCSNVVFVGQGKLRVYITGESGRELTLYYVRPGESCPVNLGAAVSGVAAYASAAADQDVRAVAISSAGFRKICQSNDALADYVFTATVLRFGDIISLIRGITTKSVDHRLAEYLLRKFDISADNPPVVETTHQNIALEIGTAREVVSRRLQELERTGAVKLRRGKIELQDRRPLHRNIR
jgi:CRP/FNR family transcriptional regulator